MIPRERPKRAEDMVRSVLWDLGVGISRSNRWSCVHISCGVGIVEDKHKNLSHPVLKGRKEKF